MTNKKGFIITILSVILLFLTACGVNIESNMSEELPNHTFTTQDEEEVSLDELNDELSDAYFMYTNCTFVCSTTKQNMLSVQNELKYYGLKHQIISFSIDTSFDTPEVLKDYDDDFGADLDHWSFLTGNEFKDIQKLSEQTFNSVLEDGGPDSHQYVHSTNFFLINPKGEIIKQYDGMSSKQTNLLIEDLKEVM